MRLIDADKLLSDNPVHITGSIFCSGGKWQPIDAIQIAAINDAPTIDAAPVKHGHWRLAWGTNRVFCYVCSECGDELISPDSVPPRAIKYCLNCGAKMDEVSE